VDIIKQLVELDQFIIIIVIIIINSEICMAEVKHILMHTCESKCLFHSTEDFTNYLIFITLLPPSNLNRMKVFKDFEPFIK
jgi:hypothetical protein